MTQAYTVIGGGVMGLCVATELMGRGADVCVVDHRASAWPLCLFLVGRWHVGAVLLKVKQRQSRWCDWVKKPQRGGRLTV